MKVIDLLNKIANGEVEENKEYLFNGSDYCTIREFFNRYIVDKENLNLEVETLGADKKIQLLPIIDGWCEDIPERNQVRRKINEIIDKLNEGE